LDVHGLTVDTLQRQHGMTPIAAFLTLDWLSRDPEAALASLHKGHDHLGRA
jgi:hypothetical protein